MKRLFSLLLAFIMILSLCGCEGNFGSVDLNDPIAIPDDGVIKENIIKEIQSENTIGIFTGEYDGVKYEWTIFGSDVVRAEEVNLLVKIFAEADGGIRVDWQQRRTMGFSALLSIYLDEQWEAQSATAYTDKAFASVSVTGSKNTILNLTLDGTETHFVIRPDALPEDEQGTQNPEGTTSNQPSSTPAGGQDNSSAAGQNGEKDKYLTDPVPEGKPKPVEPEDTEVNKGTSYACTFSIECSTILNNLEMLDPEKLEMVPSGGVILAKTTVAFYEGESVFDVLQRLCKETGIHMEASWTPIYNSAYVEGIHNLYEFDCGALSGWMYKVNGWYPNYGSSRYQLKDGDVVEWRYTCDLGNDVGGGYAVGG